MRSENICGYEPGMSYCNGFRAIPSVPDPGKQASAELEELPPIPWPERIGEFVGKCYRSIRSWIARVDAEYAKTKWEKILSVLRDLLTLAAGVFKPKI
jgi:hypothetical protein